MEKMRCLASSAAEQEESELLKRISGGDQKAFESMYRIYFPRLAQFLRRLLWSARITEEVINDTMYVVWSKADTYNQNSKISTWIFSIAYRQGLKALSKLEVPLEMDIDALTSDENSAPEQIFSEAQLRLHIEFALDRLSFEHRSVMVLTYYHGMSCNEIACALGCSVNTIKSRMFYARRKLKVMLSTYQEEAS